jgi:hypothetical protein
MELIQKLERKQEILETEVSIHYEEAVSVDNSCLCITCSLLSTKNRTQI